MFRNKGICSFIAFKLKTIKKLKLYFNKEVIKAI